MANRVIQPKAIRSGQKARVALAGPTGSGKTWTSLDIATVLADGKGILVIDTERGSASLYGDEYDFAVVDWAPPYAPKELAAFVTEQSRNFGCIVIDSLTHFWEGEGGLLSIVDDAGRQNGGNSWSGWKKGTPIQAAMVDAILAATCHTIVTIRSKMVSDLVEDEKTKRKKVVKLGLAPVQRAGIEYEFSVMGEMDQEHRLTISKSRCHPLADRTFPAGKAKEMAKILVEWLSSAAVQEPAPQPSAEPTPEPPQTNIPPASGWRPASANQLATISKLSRLLGRSEEIREDLTSAEASDQITDLSRRYNELKGIPLTGPRHEQEADTTDPEADTSALIPPPPESVKKTGVVAEKDEAAAISKEYAAATQMDVSTVQRWARQKLEAAGVKLPPAAEWTAKDYGVYTEYVKQALVEFRAQKAAREEAEKSTEPRELETVQL